VDDFDVDDMPGETRSSRDKKAAKQLAVAVGRFRSAVYKALNNEDAVALRRAIEVGEAAGLRTTKEQRLLRELTKGVGVKESKVEALVRKLSRALVEADVDDAEAALTAAQQWGLVKQLSAEEASLYMRVKKWVKQTKTGTAASKAERSEAEADGEEEEEEEKNPALRQAPGAVAVGKFRSAVYMALNNEDAAALRRAIEVGEAAGLRTSKEQRLLRELTKGAAASQEEASEAAEEGEEDGDDEEEDDDDDRRQHPALRRTPPSFESPESSAWGAVAPVRLQQQRGAEQQPRDERDGGGGSSWAAAARYGEMKKVANRNVRDFRVGDELTGAVTRRPPISLYTCVPHTGGYTYAVGVWDLSIVQGPFSAAPCQTLMQINRRTHAPIK
jgi:hypothetical protein